MRDVTVVMDRYRECVRHVWNAYFAAEAREDADWDAIDDFNAAAGYLFRALVLRELGHEAGEADSLVETRQEPLLFLRVVVDPIAEIHINRELTSGYWDYPLTRVAKDDLELAFLGYFDWAVVDHRDFAYYRVRIVGSAKYPDVVGKDALVPIGPHIRVLGEAAQQADGAVATRRVL
jgi:hypothetical protein